MADAFLVRRLQRFENPNGNLQRLLDRERTTTDPGRQRVSFDELEYQEPDERCRITNRGGRRGLGQVVNGRDAGVIEGRDRLRLAMKTGDAFGSPA
jgi:hypothetical protein